MWSPPNVKLWELRARYLTILMLTFLTCNMATQPYFNYKTVWRRFQPPPFCRNSPSPLCIFFWNPDLWQHFLRVSPDEMWNKRKNKFTKKSRYFMLRRLQNYVTCFFYKQHLYKQHQIKIWLEIIAISGIKKKRIKININIVTGTIPEH